MKLLTVPAALCFVAATGLVAQAPNPFQPPPATQSFNISVPPSTGQTPQAAPSSSSGWNPNSWKDLHSYIGFVGFGFTVPVGTTHNRLDTGWNFLAGFGPRFGHYFSLPVMFDYQRSGASKFDQTAIDGNMRMWSLTINPRVDVDLVHGVGWYGDVGYGLYNRRVQITQSTLVPGVFCDPWWGFCSTAVVPGTAILGEHSVYNGGWNFGTGFTFGPQKMRFFAEVRYHYMYTSPTRTSTLPITFGVRW